MSRIQEMRVIVEESTASRVDNCFVDIFTASAYTQVHDRLSERNQEILENLGITDAMAKVWGVVDLLEQRRRL